MAREEGDGEGYNRGTEQRHPSHAVAAQLHSATSILPACLHSHSVDPFTEGMSHTLSSSPSPPPLPRRILSSPHRTPARWLCCSPPPPTNPVSVSHECFSFYLIPSIPLLHPSSPTFAPLPSRSLFLPPPPLSLSLLSSLVRLYILPKCPSFSLTLLCDAGR